MGLFFKLFRMSKSGQRDHKPVTPEISNDELVTAHEWVDEDGRKIYALSILTGEKLILLRRPQSVDATLRKLGAE